MKLSKKQIKNLLDNINWRIDDPCQKFNIDDLEMCLRQACIDFDADY